MTALSGDFLSSLLVDMAFLFIGPPECTLVQRGGERESKTVHVKLPRQHNGKKLKKKKKKSKKMSLILLSTRELEAPLIAQLLSWRREIPLEASCKYSGELLKEHIALPIC